mgnify:CR=1 FL=1
MVVRRHEGPRPIILSTSNTLEYRCKTGSTKTLPDEPELCRQGERRNRQIVTNWIYQASETGSVAKPNRGGS